MSQAGTRVSHISYATFPNYFMIITHSTVEILHIMTDWLAFIDIIQVKESKTMLKTIIWHSMLGNPLWMILLSDLAIR